MCLLGKKGWEKGPILKFEGGFDGRASDFGFKLWYAICFFFLFVRNVN